MEERHLATELKGSTKWGVFWWAVAAGLHVAAIGCVIYFSPLREWFLKRSDPGQNLGALEGARMIKIARQMIEVHTRRIREKVVQQKNTLAALADIRDQRYERYAQQTEMMRRQSREAPEVVPLASLGAAGPDPNIPLERKDVLDLYEAAKAIETTTYGTYRQMRAIELARVQALSLNEAMEATNVAMPTHEGLNPRVFSEPITNATDGKLEALKQELFKAHAEVSSMLAAGLRMLDMANGLMAGDVGGTTVFGAGGNCEPGGSGVWGSDVGPPLAPHEYFPGATDGNFGESFRPTPGRKIMDGGIKAEWMYLDTWYIIGPFPNPSRMHMDTKFPPESAIDLDTTYIGKDGLRLDWRFRQSPELMIAPHMATNYAIWYAYTELYCEADQNRWVIFGSDDYSKTWVNGELIWTSGKTPHHWIPDRGYRKVRFRKGYNQILLKLENAGGTTGYSMAIYLGEVTGS